MVSALPDENRKIETANHLKKYHMESQRVTPIEDRLEIIQDVIDRLLYLSLEDMEIYKGILNDINKKFALNVIKENGVRIYLSNKTK